MWKIRPATFRRDSCCCRLVTGPMKLEVRTDVSWKPIHQAHAIERVRISIQFQSQVPAPMAEIVGRLFDARRDSLGFSARTETPAHQFVIDQTQAAQAAPRIVMVGWQASRVLHNGNVVEVVGLEPNSLVHEIAEYTRWANQRERYEAVCGELVMKLREGVIPAAITLEYFDRFVFHGPQNLATARGLLVKDIMPLLPDEAAAGAELWHIHRGWFEKAGASRLLVNQNFDIQDGVGPDGAGVRSLALYTKVEKAAHSNPIDMMNFAADLEELHALSRRVLERTLVPQAKKAINLV